MMFHDVLFFLFSFLFFLLCLLCPLFLLLFLILLLFLLFLFLLLLSERTSGVSPVIFVFLSITCFLTKIKETVSFIKQVVSNKGGRAGICRSEIASLTRRNKPRHVINNDVVISLHHLVIPSLSVILI